LLLYRRAAAMAAAFVALRNKRRKNKEQEPEETEEEKARKMMAELDADGDGNVTPEEVAAYMARQAQEAVAKAAAAKAARAAARHHSYVTFLPYRAEVQSVYEHRYVQRSVAFVILFNFIAIVVEKQIDPYPPEYQSYPNTWARIDDVCTVVFLFELIVNMYGSFILPFFLSAWNWLDLVVVIVGTVSLAKIDLGSFAKIKVLRAFRVLRLFKRIRSLNKILVALLKAIPGVLNAFAVMLIFMTIYAVLAVELFRDFGHTAEYTTLQLYGQSDAQYGESCGADALDCISGSKLGGKFENTTVVSAMTPRGFFYGQEYYGDFSKALYTLFQVLTGESWSEAVVRPLLFGYSRSSSFMVGAFFTSYILLTQVVLQNVVVAVLLDKFVEDPDKKEGEEGADKAGEGGALGSPQSLPSKGGEGGSAPMTDTDLRSAVGKILQDQELMKAQLEQILSRLPPGPSRPASRRLEA